MNFDHSNKWFIKLLRFICPRLLFEEIEGDLIQRFHRDFRQYGEKRARRRFLWNTLRFFRPGIMMRNKFVFDMNGLSMLKNHWAVAGRNLLRNKAFALINILGLSISMAVSLLIFQYVKFELSYDRFHETPEKIYRVTTAVSLQKEVINNEANTYEGIAQALKTDFSEVKAATTIYGFNSDKTFVRYENEGKRLTALETFKAFEVDSSFFHVFSFPLKSGDASTVLDEPFSSVISEELENQYFSGNAIGKILETKDGSQSVRYKITGIFRKVPANSHFKFDLLIRSANRDKTFWNGDISFWDWSGQTYIKLNNAADTASLKPKLNALAVANNGLKRNKDDYGQVSTFTLQPLTSIHLYSHLTEELEANGNSVLVYALEVLALIIIVIAWVNYINLSTAISEEKVRSIGVRKVIGASRMGLMSQILVESALFNLLSFLLACVLVVMLLPTFSDFAGIPLDYTGLYDRNVVIFLAGFIFISILFSGLYPAWVASAVFTLPALKGKTSPSGRYPLRKALVVFQFSAAVIFLIIMLAAYQQLSFMRSTPLGISINNVLIIKALNFDKETWSNAEGGFVVDSTYANRVMAFKEAVRSNAAVVNVTALSHLPGNLPNWGSEFKAESNDPDKAYNLKAIGIDYDFISTLQVKLLAGRNFSPDFPTDRGNEGRRAVLINEAASKLLGFKMPEQAVNSHIKTYWGADYVIIGVLNSFHQLSLKENLQPLYFILQPRALEYFAVHYNEDNPQEIIDQIHKTWSAHFPDYPFNYFFLDDYFDQQHRYEQQFSTIMSLFAGLALFIAGMGLFGLTSYNIVQRTKEIGIRKVLGATAAQIIGLFSRDFIKLMALAVALGVPLVYYGITLWLQNYAYKIELRWWLFAGPAILVLFLALITMSLQTIRVALRNPVTSLKHE